MLSRRTFLQASGSVSATLLLPTLALSNNDDGFLELRAQKADIHLEGPESSPSPLWTYAGQTPGPEIRIRQGQRVKVRFFNDLPEPTSIHWHGIRIDNKMDGVSGLTQEPVAPGQSFDYDFIAPDAGTYWYHAHNKSWNQVARGLYGPLIIEEAEPAFPSQADITLVIDDWRLDNAGVLHTDSLGAIHDWSHAGRLGNYLTVNGKSQPVISLEQNKPHRVRLINTSNARIITLQPDQIGAQIIALDGQALSHSRMHEGPFLLAPAQRADFLLFPRDAGSLPLKALTHDGSFEFARFNVEASDNEPEPIPPLPVNNIPEPDVANGRLLPLVMTGGAMGGGFGEMIYKGQPLTRADIRQQKQMWAFNNHVNMDDTPFLEVKHGETIVVEMTNDTAFPHAMHVHGHHFRVLDDQGVAGDWRDTVLLHRNEKIKIAFVADNPGNWLIHCHMLEHAAGGMVNWFRVT